MNKGYICSQFKTSYSLLEVDKLIDFLRNALICEIRGPPMSCGGGRQRERRECTGSNAAVQSPDAVYPRGFTEE